MAVPFSVPVIPKAPPGFTFIFYEVIPRESLGLEISYQMVISDIFDLLGASRTEVSRAASMTIPKVDPKAKRPLGGSQGEVLSKNGKTLHTNVPMAMSMALVWPLTNPLQIMSVEDSLDGRGSSEPDPPLYTCDFFMEGAPLPSTKGVRPWADRHVGKEADYVKCPFSSYRYGELEDNGSGGDAFSLEEECGLLDGEEFTKEYLRPLVCKSFFQAFVEGWTSALDKQEVVADLVLRNEEEIPIPNNYLPIVLAVTKGDRGGSVAEEEAPET
nr:hypothetical protein CFP56_44120 [Quercus suber]